MMECIPAETSVAVLEGGTSEEREVSLNTGRNCAEALRTAGFKVSEYDTADLGFIEALRRDQPDVAFIALHGRGGEDGTMQGLLELLGIPYTGSGVLASALAMDKEASKAVYRQAGLATPPGFVARRGEEFFVDSVANKVADQLGDKVVVKPNSEGSSVGITIVQDREALADALREAFRFDDRVLIERFIPGREIMAGVIGNTEKDIRSLPLIEVEATADFYDYDSKYAPGGSRHVLPAPLDEDTTQTCQKLAAAAHTALGCRGCSRSDIRLDSYGIAWLLETNTLPGMTSTSLVPEAARAMGLDFPNLVKLLVNLAK
ncbi:MAG: D-alanine--D-alanine ligase [Actinomycetes bacterium]|jgi:D-alanine-D-alanine ligase|nr:D-alanine--D-alanine ligase [Actinomycetes bacterium]